MTIAHLGTLEVDAWRRHRFPRGVLRGSGTFLIGSALLHPSPRQPVLLRRRQLSSPTLVFSAMSDNRIRVGVMGQGRSGYNIHVRCMAGVESVKEKFVVVAVADQLDVRRQQAKEELGCEVYDDWRKMLDAGGFDMVVNSLPSPLHVDATIYAFKKGYHVLSEKPLAKKVGAATPPLRAAACGPSRSPLTAPTSHPAGRRRRLHS